MMTAETLPFIQFMNAENTTNFFQNVTAILYVVMPLLIIYIATHYGADFIKMIRESFSGKSQKDKDYDIKIKEKE